jgi:hypothetical protein
MLTKVNKLSDKALLVKLTLRRAALTKRDNVLTQTLQAQENDRGLTVLTRLFKDKHSPINAIMAKYGEVYAYHKQHTLPYIDAGPRILPSSMYFEYAQEMKQRIAAVESMLNAYMPDYDQLVRDDVINRNSGSAHGRGSIDEYPSAEDFRAAMSAEMRFQPMPDTRHFLFDISDEDMDAFERAEHEAVATANADTINRMLKPLQALALRLNEYQGNKGERFHNSVVENLVDGCKLARKLAINPTPELLNEITQLESMAQGYLDDVEIIKGSANARDEAKRRLAEVAAKMSAFTA